MLLKIVLTKIWKGTAKYLCVLSGWKLMFCPVNVKCYSMTSSNVLVYLLDVVACHNGLSIDFH